jgi:hypothetical protein
MSAAIKKGDWVHCIALDLPSHYIQLGGIYRVLVGQYYDTALNENVIHVIAPRGPSGPWFASRFTLARFMESRIGRAYVRAYERLGAPSNGE